MFEYYDYINKVPKERYLQMDEILRKFFIKLHGIEKYKKRKDFFDNEGFDMWLNTIRNDEDYHIILYLDNNDIIGFICYKFVEDHAWICEVQLIEKYQYKGYVKILINEMINHINKEECKYFLGSINDNNEHSKNTFTHIGFNYNEDERRYEISYNDLNKYVKTKKMIK